MAVDRPSVRRAPLILAGFLLGLLVYLTLFFRAGFDRSEALLVAFLPDQVLSAWIGGDPLRIGLADRLFLAGGAGSILLAAAIGGWLSLRLAGCDRDLTRLETLVFSIGVGLSELSLLTLLIGLAGWLHQAAVFRLILFAIAGLGLYRWRIDKRARSGDSGTRSIRFAHRPRTQPTPLATATCDGSLAWLARRGLWLALPFVLLTLLGGMMPPWEFDVREYHLQVPKEWYQAGQIAFLPHNVYGNMPLGAEMHAVLAMGLLAGWADWWWGALIGKTVMACFAPLTGLALYAAVRRHVSPTAGAAAALIYVSTPWVIHVSMTGLNEGAVACYALLAVAAVVSWQRGTGGGASIAPGPRHHAADTASRSAGGPLLLAGFCAGSAAACKYPALLFVVLPVAVWCWLVARGTRWKSLALFLAAALLACAPWYAKNAALAGNPVYPLVFGGTTRTPPRMEQWNRAHRVPPDSQGRCYTPVQAADSLALLAWRSRWVSPLLLPLACLAWLDQRFRRRAIPLYLLIAWVVLVWWLTTHRVDRFLVPAMAWAAWLAGMGLAWSLWRPWQNLATALLVLGLTFNLLYVISSGEYDRRLLVSLSDLRRDEPQEPGGPSRVASAHRYLNAAVGPDQRVLLVGDAQPFDLEVPAVYHTCFDECIFERWMRDRSREQRREILRAQRVSHIYFDWSEIARYRRPGNYGFTDWVTPALVHDELVRQQGLLRRVPLDIDPVHGELFEVLDAVVPQTEEERAGQRQEKNRPSPGRETARAENG